MFQHITCFVLDNNSYLCNGVVVSPAQPATESQFQAGSMWFFIYLGICVALVLFGGMMSGLTIGLMSLDMMSLEILHKGGEPDERIYAGRIMPVVKRRHLLLVTLLLSNAAAMEALPIFLDRISTPIVAIVISVTMVLIFGEVIPQALCSRYGLAIGARMAWLVQVLMILLFIVAWPISKLLDLVLGAEHTDYFQRDELGVLVGLHGHEGHLTIDESTIIKGALAMKSKTVRDAMQPLTSVFMLDYSQPLSPDTLRRIRDKGHSRIPIYQGDNSQLENIRGILLLKGLLFADLSGRPQISQFELRDCLFFPASTELYDALNHFQTGRSHLAVVHSDGSNEVLGIVTLEDVIEELIQEEILDEEDLAEHYLQQTRELAANATRFTRGTTQAAATTGIVVSKDLGESSRLLPPTETVAQRIQNFKRASFINRKRSNQKLVSSRNLLVRTSSSMWAARNADVPPGGPVPPRDGPPGGPAPSRALLTPKDAAPAGGRTYQKPSGPPASNASINH
eukprot:TRINITY_DN15542_c0_g1_i1.p1 TRINITY_DN15542_c0_g1~~TRINITY_DN15542_c0_g1_i1.p1  ORF type:complete len:510 (+),score=193.81 TRINITY_DN15542_c0_g1_i1:156-1685(+)